MKSYQLVSVAGVVGSSLVVPVAALREEPNIIVVFLDDAGFADVGFNGGDIFTPNLDRLNDEGLAIERFYADATCTPARAALMTGQYAWRSGFTEFGVIGYGDTDCLGRILDLDAVEAAGEPYDTPIYIELRDSLTLGHPDAKILPERFKEAGYATHHIGKWHLGNSDTACYPENRGFDSAFGMLNGYTDHFAYLVHSATVGNLPHSPGRLNPDDPLRYDGYDLHDTREPDGIHRISEPSSETYSTNLFGRRAVDIINEHDAANPLFVYLALTAPHNPLQADPQDLQLPECQQYAATRPARQYICAMMAAVDRAVSDIEMALKARDMWDNTILLFTSDNGGPHTPDVAPMDFGQDNGPFREGKLSYYDGGPRTFAFFAGGRVPSNSRIDGGDFVHITDVAPTLLGAANVAPDPSAEFDGRDLSAALGLRSGSDVPPASALDLEPRSVIFAPRRDMLLAGATMGPIDWNFTTAVVVGEYNDVLYKYALTAHRGFGFIRTGGPELFDLRDDPGETTDVSAGNETVLEHFENLLSAFTAEAPKFKRAPYTLPGRAHLGAVMAFEPSNGCWLAPNDPHYGVADCTDMMLERLVWPRQPGQDFDLGVGIQCLDGINVLFPPHPIVRCNGTEVSEPAVSDAPAEDGADASAEDGSDAPAEDGSDAPAEDGSDAPADDPVEDSANNPGDAPAEDSADAQAEDSAATSGYGMGAVALAASLLAIFAV